MGFPRTCLHSLLAILDLSVAARTVPFAEVPKPRMLDSAYFMLYSLCANTKTSEPFLRFLPFAEVPTPRLLDSAYFMLYSLCANTKTSEPVLRFLRSCNDFLARHLASLPFTSEPQQSELLLYFLTDYIYRCKE